VQAVPTVEQVMAKYNSSVRLVFVHFPLNSLHPLAQKAAEAAECANDQGKFWEMHDKLFATSPDLGVPALKADAAALGLDMAKFNACLDNGDKAPLIAAFVKLVSDSQISSTPTFIVNGEQMSDRSFEAFDKKIQSILNPPRAVINTTGRPVWGNASAPVKIIEFSDFQCPYCEMGYQTVKSVEQNYAGQVSITFMQFPLSFHPLAQKAAEAAECANDQGKFWEFHDKLFSDRSWTTDASNVPAAVLYYKSAAKGLGLDTAKFDACLDGGSKAAAVSADQAIGSANGISGTPGFFINGLALKGYLPYEQFKKYIDTELTAVAANATKKK
jgi:protein-disulfide isomerase